MRRYFPTHVAVKLRHGWGTRALEMVNGTARAEAGHYGMPTKKGEDNSNSTVWESEVLAMPSPGKMRKGAEMIRALVW